MCGINGSVRLGGTVVEDLLRAAARMENRGPQSVALVTAHAGKFYPYREAAPPEIAFHGLNMMQFPGRAGICHTRYATTGQDSPEAILRNAGPALGDIALVHNGDTVNAELLRENLRRGGKMFHTETDTEVIHALIEREFRRRQVAQAKTDRAYANRVFASLRTVQSKIVGGWSILILTARGLIAWRGPAGIRPLLMAKRFTPAGALNEIAFASESSVFNALGGYRQITDVAPGMAIFVPNDLSRVYVERLSYAGEKFCFFEFIYLARPDSRFDRIRAEVVRDALGRELACQYDAELRGKFDIVVPVPDCPQSTAASFAAHFGVPVKHAIRKVGNKRSFLLTSDEKRRRAIDDKFIFIREFIAGQRIVLIDDSLVRGTTMGKLIGRLFTLGAAEVHIVQACPPIIGSCFYGVDTPDDGKLEAWHSPCQRPKTANEIVGDLTMEAFRNYPTTDREKFRDRVTLRYISLARMMAAIGLPAKRLCLGCLTRQYPTPTDGAELKRAQRIAERSA